MSRSRTVLLAAVGGFVVTVAALGQGAQTVRVKGSDTVGGTLGPALARAFMVRNNDIQVEWEALGSSTAFVGLFDGTAELGAASRAVRSSELEEAKRFGIRLREWVLGYDGLAILVHPENTVTQLTQAQLRSIFSGEVLNWSEVGGPNLPVQPVVRPPYSGTYGFFRDEVLRGDGVDRDFSASATEFEHSEQAVEFVSRRRGAVAFLGMGWVQPRVRAVPIVGDAGAAVLPQLTTVRAGSYPLFRPLFLYSRGIPGGATRTLLKFLLGPDGQRIVEDNGFIAADTQLALRQLEGTGQSSKDVEVERLTFVLGGSRVDLEMRTRAEALARRIRAENARALLIGHADSQGDAVANRRLSLRRAQVVADLLVAAGVPRSSIEVEARGDTQPVSSNASAAGRTENRRVDVRVLPGG